MAAAGSAVGLGNIWSFPTQVASNGGAAFLFVYIILTAVLAFPALIAEIAIGKHTRTNLVDAFSKIKGAHFMRPVGYIGLICITLILSFYSIIGGWMVVYLLKSLAAFCQFTALASLFEQQSTLANIIGTSIFYLMTILIITAGMKDGIEAWSKKLMPLLVVVLIGLIFYVATLDGALQGFRHYLVPDFSKIFHFPIFMSALGQAFFSASLGVGVMIVYGSYLKKDHSIIRVGSMVLLFDFLIAFLAGLLIIPAMYAASASGANILDSNGILIEGKDLVFQILPALFASVGVYGQLVMAFFFLLMLIAALTSSISMLEVPVSYGVDKNFTSRKNISWIVGLVCWGFSMVITAKFELLFGLIIKITTQYLQPLGSVGYAILGGWFLKRSDLALTLLQGNDQPIALFFLTIFRFFLRFVIPFVVIAILIQQFL